jgi:hypothetical protein
MTLIKWGQHLWHVTHFRGMGRVWYILHAFLGRSILGARASCDRSEDMTRRLWSHKHPASLWWVQYSNSVCDWSIFMWVFSLVNRWASVNQWKDSHKYWPITNRVQILNSPKWGWMLVWPEPPRRVLTSITRGSGTQGRAEGAIWSLMKKQFL